jgi:lysophospholipase L1-like esterase
MRIGRTIGMGIVAAGLVGAAVLAKTVRDVQGAAAGDIDSFLGLPDDERTRRPVVAVIGASIVRGRASVDFVRMLREEHLDLAFVNGGVNGRVCWEMLQDMNRVMACDPAFAVILVGTNDVQATLSDEARDMTRRSKGLPRNPSPEWFGDCLLAVVNRLQTAGTHVAVCSLPPLGQDLDSPANDAVRTFNAVIREVADATGATYLPVHERMAEVIVATGREEGPAYTGSWRPGLESLVGHFTLGRSYDDIAQRAGFLLSPDGVHLDTAGARIVANLVHGFLTA